MTAPLAYDGSYCKSVSGILKFCCLICALLGCLCIIVSTVQLHNMRGTVFLAVTVFGFFCSAFVLLARLFQVWQRKFYHFDYIRFEMFLNGFLASAFFIASSVTLSLDVISYSLATFFGLLGFCFYAYDAYLGYLLSRKCDVSTQTQIV